MPALSAISVTGARGEWSAPATAVPGNDAEIVMPLPSPLAEGSYRVRWHAVSADMHEVEGDFGFEVAP
jgi:methionine-rich copper-binding protein CopC